jgi:alkanesulfonate monooxygenase SsuD/methylene tetrahydromethanopterin reductase-like flavin-dependent oxidoreductase (luciferase family)
MKTHKMDLMTSIAVAFSRNPMSLAYIGNDLQNLSGGRFTLGLGSQVKANKLSREGNWMELTNLIDDDILKTFAVVGTPTEVAHQIAGRFKGKVDRISPVVYQPDLALLTELQSRISEAVK